MITNTHIHSPYSYSTFDTIDQIVRQARADGIAVLGINDINTCDGFRDFAGSCAGQGIYPLFNIAFVIRCEEAAGKGARQPGTPPPTIRCVHGKALRYPAALSGDSRNLIASIWKASQDRIWKMIDALNIVLTERRFPVVLDYNFIRSTYAKTSLLEQHLARALYNAFTSQWKSSDERIKMFRRLFDDETFDCDIADARFVQREISDRLMAKGKAAYIDEPAQSHMLYFQAKQVILQAGGIPCYQCSFTTADGQSNGRQEPAALARHLLEKGIHAIEFIPHLTTFDKLREYMHYFSNHHFCVTVGTGEPAPHQASLIPVTGDGRTLDRPLIDISYNGACILAAHQELHHQKRRGFVDEAGKPITDPEQLEDFIQLGDQAIRKATSR